VELIVLVFNRVNGSKEAVLVPASQIVRLIVPKIRLFLIYKGTVLVTANHVFIEDLRVNHFASHL